MTRLYCDASYIIAIHSCGGLIPDFFRCSMILLSVMFEVKTLYEIIENIPEPTAAPTFQPPAQQAIEIERIIKKNVACNMNLLCGIV